MATTKLRTMAEGRHLPGANTRVERWENLTGYANVGDVIQLVPVQVGFRVGWYWATASPMDSGGTPTWQFDMFLTDGTTDILMLQNSLIGRDGSIGTPVNTVKDAIGFRVPEEGDWRIEIRTKTQAQGELTPNHFTLTLIGEMA